MVMRATAAALLRDEGEDEQALRLFDTHQQRLFRLARRLSSNHDDAKDLVKETFTRVLRSRSPLPPDPRGQDAWLVTTLVNVARDQARRTAVRHRNRSGVQMEPGDSPDATYVAKIAVGDALARLDARRRAVVVLHELEGEPVSREDDAIAAARELTAQAPRDGWSWLALAGALHYKGGHPDEATSAAAKALELMPANLYAVWMRGHTLSGDPAQWQEAVSFVDSQLRQVSDPALLLVKAYVLYSQSLGPRDEAKMNAAFATLEDAQRLDPSSVSAFYLHGTYLESQRRPDDAYPRLKRAVALAPDSTPVREAYWTSIRNSRQFDADQKRAEIERDVAAFLEKNHDRPGALSAA